MLTGECGGDCVVRTSATTHTCARANSVNQRNRWWVWLGLLAASCATTTPVPAAGTWRNVAQVYDVPPGDLGVTLREDGTGFLEMPEKFFWFFDKFTWTRQDNLLSILGEGEDRPMQFLLSFSDSDNVIVRSLVDGEPQESVWQFRRE